MDEHLSFWRAANPRFRRDEKSKIVKQNDYLMDATRYLILSGLQVACREPREEAADERHWIDSTRSDVSVWAARAAQKLYTSPQVGYPVRWDRENRSIPTSINNVIGRPIVR
jgi:hypothetical protein